MMKESIENEFITWHSFPHVPEYEVMDKYVLIDSNRHGVGLLFSSVFRCLTTSREDSTSPIRSFLMIMMYFSRLRYHD